MDELNLLFTRHELKLRSKVLHKIYVCFMYTYVRLLTLTLYSVLVLRTSCSSLFAAGLPNTKLGTYLENRINSFLKKKNTGAGDVTIRVLSSSDKLVEVKPGMKQRYLSGFVFSLDKKM